MIEYMIREAITEYMRETGKSKRESIYKANEIIKALGQECRLEEETKELRRVLGQNVAKNLHHNTYDRR